DGRRAARRRRPGPRLHRRDQRPRPVRDHADPDQGRSAAARLPDPGGPGGDRRRDPGGRPRPHDRGDPVGRHGRARRDDHRRPRPGPVRRLGPPLRDRRRAPPRGGDRRRVPRQARPTGLDGRRRVIRVIVGAILAPIFIVGLGLIGLAAGGSRSLDAYLILSGLLFAIGSFGFLARRNAISMLMSIELMLNAVNLAIVAFGSFVEPLKANSSVIALIVMAVAAGEATVGLAIVIAIYPNRRTPLVDEYDAMRQ